jgi:hypothetical protein
MEQNPAVKERLMLIRQAENLLRRVAHSQLSADDADILDAVHKLLWTVYRRIERGKT